MLPDTIGRDVFRHLSSARSQLRWMRAVMPQSHGSSARQCANAAGAARSERLRLRQPSAVHAQTHDADLLSGDASSCGRRSVLASITAAGALCDLRTFKRRACKPSHVIVVAPTVPPMGLRRSSVGGPARSGRRSCTNRAAGWATSSGVRFLLPPLCYA